MKKQSLGILALISTLGLVAGCSSARDVSLTGTVTAEAAAGDGPIRIDFYQHESSGSSSTEPSAASDLKFVETLPLATAGKFTHTVPIEGDKVHLVAFIDANKDEKCTDGEAWGQTEVSIQNDAATATVNIAAQTKCPALALAN